LAKTDLSTLLDRYQRVVELANDLASTLDLHTLLNQIVHAAAELCHAEAAAILLYDEATKQLHFVSSTNLDAPLMRGLLVPVDSSIAGWILTERKPAIIHQTKDDPRHFNKVAQATDVETESLLGVPLITKDQVIGVLEVINKHVGQFTIEDQEILVALGSQAAVAIVNARLFQQSDLISEFVHEIRTPLTSIEAAGQLLLKPDVTEQQRHEIVDTMRREVNRLNAMTSSFLDIAQLESGRSRLNIIRIEASELLEESVVMMQGKLEEKGLSLELQIVPWDLCLCADYDKIKQVILNLLSNAIKYSPPGGQISITAEVSDDDVVIRVSDTGMGISGDNLPRIFDKFYRVPGADNSVEGSGLGLTICKRIVESHNGQIQASSEAGVGSTFSIILPQLDLPPSDKPNTD
jgi:signal transduction histidine kinase